MARNIQFQPAQNKDTRTASAPQSLFNAGSPSAPARSDRDSVYSDSDTPNARASLSRKQSASSVPAARSVIATIEQTSARPKWTGGLSEAEAHLLIFLKEVNKLRWTEITEKFQEHYPHRSYGVLQTNYSQKINRRDRTQDPPALILPACYAAETRISWDEVHAGPSRPNDHSRQRKRDVEILREQLRHQTQPSALPAWSAAVESLQEPSSGAESSSLAKRPRRAVPVKNYTWPKRNTLPRDESFDGVDHDMLESVEDRLVQSESPEDLVPAPEKAIAVDNEPLSVEFEEDDASLGLITQSRNAASNPQHLPYLSSPQRSSLQDATRGLEWDQLVSRNWQGTLIHVDFSPAELTLVEGALTRLVDSPRALRVPGQQRRLQRLLSGLTEPKFLRLTNALRSKLPSRDRRSIEAFLYDARDGRIRSRDPRVERMAAARPDQSFSSDAKLSVSSMIRRRETDVQSHRGWSSGTRPLSYQLKNKVQDSLGPVSSYTGASSDVHAVAWSIDGQCFAAGAICVDDPHSLQYNRSNNLLYGDVSYNTINELGKHHVMRPKPESGPNSTHAMYSSQDPKLYKTVTSVAFSPNGRYLFSSGYDQNVAVWETKYDGSQPTELVALHHKAEVTMMTVNSVGVLATGTEKCTGNAVKVIRLNDDDPSEAPATINFQSAKASERLDMKIKPIALHFSPRYENFLLGGFGASARQDGRDIAGDICLWDIDGQATLSIWGSGKNVFDLSFHPRQRWFAVGTVAGQNTNRGTRSTVRLYDEHNGGQHSKFSMSMELECRAQDINDVVWCPGDDFLLAAGCTSGRAYVWDVRNPNHFLRELAHGSSLMPLDEDIDRELTDTGVRFLTWGDNATRLYTGSSDGVVKVWNVVRSEEETFVKDLITLDSGIMSGAFSPDRSRLLLGEVNGSVNVLEVGRDDCSLKDAEKMRFIPYNGDFDDMQSTQSTTAADMDSGFATAKDLLETGQMVTVPMGGLPIRQAVQGPAYAGPFDTGVDAPFLREQALEMQLKMAETPASHCSIPTCQEAVSKITSEESGDSGRSADRIPDALRLQWETPPSHLAAVPGKTHCSNCGRTARPSPSSDEVFCERCAFSCFRCGAINQIAASTEIIQCYGCECVWDIGALGYDLVPTDKPGWAHSATAANFSGVPRLDGYSRELREARREAKSPLCESKTSFGDEMNALTDYYFSLAIDRPESPPL
ncbi:WD40 repeat-like protein [Bimuria novae-zelandiae CBS 107.79]|uniref:WD40 repeat-like protein n=1 Tax=Bimuria novae-zelandiae CBS 107.79 TaxID=1447943 RepID=A0A6A5VPH1_9PLEO|nr:WD40 repeat-like protein [Bimuria novae-zelandiae CBS 107.79]